MQKPPHTEPNLKIAGLSIWVHGRQFPNSSDYWDGNWLRVTARCSNFAATVQIDGSIIHLGEIVGLMRTCERLYETLSGDAALKCIEPNLAVLLSAKTGGHIDVKIDLMPECRPDGPRSSHEFRDEIDQTYLPSIIESCKAIIDAYPLRDAEKCPLLVRPPNVVRTDQ